MNHFTLIIPMIICGPQCYRSAHTRLCIAVIIRRYMAINYVWEPKCTRIRPGQPRNRGLIAGRCKNVFSPVHRDQLWAPFILVLDRYRKVVKLTRLWFWLRTPSSATAKCNLPNTPTSPRLHGVLRDKFTPVHTRPVKHAARGTLWCGHLTFSCL